MNVHAILLTKGHEVATIAQQASLADAANELRDRRIGALVVSDDGSHIDGILSERDIVRALAAHGAGALGKTVASVMSREVVTCRDADTVDTLMQQMTDGRIRHLPVIDDAQALTGIVSIGDVVKTRLGQLENENQALSEYITHGR